ncbi:MAG: VCBS repeat-containing protein [Planctomycetaceae bacterium]|nr:VCBS repeat-containing protein [Planctomycetaceae bacterium]
MRHARGEAAAGDENSPANPALKCSVPLHEGFTAGELPTTVTKTMDHVRWVRGAMRPRASWKPVVVLVELASSWGCSQQPQDAPVVPQSKPAVVRVDDAAVERFCSGCHPLPRPDSFAKEQWREEVTFAYGFHLESGRLDLIPPPREAAVAYFESRAPATLQLDPPLQTADRHQPSPVEFIPKSIVLPRGESPAVARIEPRHHSESGWVATDMRGGGVWELTPGKWQPRLSARLPHPAGVAQLLFGDPPQPGCLYADLGSFLPADHTRGKVWWRPFGGDTLQPLITDLGRVSHLAVGDLDADGDDDLVVSEFGWRTTGRLRAYWNNAPHLAQPQLTETLIDPRHGAVRAEVVDLDGDGRLEVVAAFAQEHESVDIYRPTQQRTFVRERVYQGVDPAVGTSSLLVVDLDQDGRRDILVAHGDSFDGGPLRPQHGVIWLQQSLGGAWIPRDLGRLPGVHAVAAGDLDGDRDLDLLAVCLLPKLILQQAEHRRLAAVVWLEQRDGAEFVPHVLEWDTCQHAAAALADWDDDGDLDGLVGNYAWEPGNPELLKVWLNCGPRARPVDQGGLDRRD